MPFVECLCSTLVSYPWSTKFTSMFIYRASQVTKHVTGRPYVTNRISETEGKIREAQGSGWLHCSRYTDPDDSGSLLTYNCDDKQLMLSFVEWKNRLVRNFGQLHAGVCLCLPPLRSRGPGVPGFRSPGGPGGPGFHCPGVHVVQGVHRLVDVVPAILQKYNFPKCVQLLLLHCGVLISKMS